MHRVSPSQITAARGCLRRWWWQSIKGFKSPPTPATEFGGKVHASLESRIMYGSWPPIAEKEVLACAEKAWQALQANNGLRGDAEVEGEWSITDSDYVLPASGRFDLFLPHDNLIVDWKTTSDLRYAKTQDQQLEDPQVLLYVDALHRAGKLTLPARFAHVYTVTRGKPLAQYREVVIDEEQLSIGRKGINATMQQMADHVDTQDFQKVPANLMACKDFGGCPHWGRCFGKENKKEEKMPEDVFASRRAQKGMINPPESAPPAKVEWSASAQMDPQPCVPAESKQRPGTVAAVTEAINTAYKPEPRVLLVGCAPLVGASDYELFDPWVLPFVAQVQEQLKVPHWGLADYGKGKVAIVAAVAQAALRGDVPKRMIVDRRSALGDACVEVLLPFYDLVISKLG